MRPFIRLTALGAALLLLAAPVYAAQIYGDYVEARGADVYTGPCFANSEFGLVGHQATIAWKIRKGEWKGVDLSGLTVVGVARANATLGDEFSNPYPARSMMIVDEKATEEQKCALVEFAQSMAGRLFENVVRVQSAPISMEVGEGKEHGSVHLKAGNIAAIRTRSLTEKDHTCGNSYTYYPPLTELSHAMPAFSVTDEFAGSGLGIEWRNFGKANAFVGTFSR